MLGYLTVSPRLFSSVLCPLGKGCLSIFFLWPVYIHQFLDWACKDETISWWFGYCPIYIILIFIIWNVQRGFTVSTPKLLFELKTCMSQGWVEVSQTSLPSKALMSLRLLVTGSCRHASGPCENLSLNKLACRLTVREQCKERRKHCRSTWRTVKVWFLTLPYTHRHCSAWFIVGHHSLCCVLRPLVAFLVIDHYSCRCN